ESRGRSKPLQGSPAAGAILRPTAEQSRRRAEEPPLRKVSALAQEPWSSVRPSSSSQQCYASHIVHKLSVRQMAELKALRIRRGQCPDWRDSTCSDPCRMDHGADRNTAAHWLLWHDRKATP